MITPREYYERLLSEITVEDHRNVYRYLLNHSDCWVLKSETIPAVFGMEETDLKNMPLDRKLREIVAELVKRPAVNIYTLPSIAGHYFDTLGNVELYEASMRDTLARLAALKEKKIAKETNWMLLKQNIRYDQPQPVPHFTRPRQMSLMEAG